MLAMVALAKGQGISTIVILLPKAVSRPQETDLSRQIASHGKASFLLTLRIFRTGLNARHRFRSRLFNVS
jgi:hypothetical protein